MAANTDREARRKRIVDRGNDRFALITGRNPNLSSTELPSPPSPPGRHERASSCPPLDEYPKSKFGRSVLTHMKRGDDDSVLEPGLNNVSEANNKMANSNGHTGPGAGKHSILPPLVKSEICSQASSVPPSESNTKTRPRGVSTNQHSSVTTTSSDHGSDRNHELTRPAAHPRHPLLAAINPNLIIHSLEVTQPSRIQFSINVAVLVVLANIRFPIIGWWFIKSLISFIPLHIVLLTNASFVILQYLDFDERRHERPHKEAAVPLAGDGSNWAEQLGDALQVGLLVMKVGGAVFTDVAVYSAIVTCFLCFK